MWVSPPPLKPWLVLELTCSWKWLTIQRLCLASSSKHLLFIVTWQCKKYIFGEHCSIIVVSIQPKLGWVTQPKKYLGLHTPLPHFTLIKCLKGHKRLQALCDCPEMPTECNLKMLRTNGLTRVGSRDAYEMFSPKPTELQCTVSIIQYVADRPPSNEVRDRQTEQERTLIHS